MEEPPGQGHRFSFSVTVVWDTKRLQPATSDRHFGQADAATDQVLPPAESYLQENWRWGAKGRSYCHGEFMFSLASKMLRALPLYWSIFMRALIFLRNPKYTLGSILLYHLGIYVCVQTKIETLVCLSFKVCGYRLSSLQFCKIEVQTGV